VGGDRRACQGGDGALIGQARTPLEHRRPVASIGGGEGVVLLLLLLLVPIVVVMVVMVVMVFPMRGGRRRHRHRRRGRQALEAGVGNHDRAVAAARGAIGLAARGVVCRPLRLRQRQVPPAPAPMPGGLLLLVLLLHYIIR
jgi:hypothetical protein